MGGSEGEGEGRTTDAQSAYGIDRLDQGMMDEANNNIGGRLSIDPRGNNGPETKIKDRRSGADDFSSDDDDEDNDHRSRTDKYVLCSLLLIILTGLRSLCCFAVLELPTLVPGKSCQVDHLSGFFPIIRCGTPVRNNL